MLRKIPRLATHMFTALGMLALMLVLLFFVLQFGSQLPIVGGIAQWTGSHASGGAEGF